LHVLDYFEADTAPTGEDRVKELQQRNQVLIERANQMTQVLRRLALEPPAASGNSEDAPLKSRRGSQRFRSAKISGKSQVGESDNDLYFKSYDELTIHHEMIPVSLTTPNIKA